MITIRSAAVALLLSSILPSNAFSATAAASLQTPGPHATISGIVRDSFGAALEGAEVLVLSPEPGGAGAVLRAVSAPNGRFVVAIAPGIYRVAAIKTGYVAALGRVNTRLRASIDLVLRPVPKEGEPGAENVLEDLSWALRVPPRGILRELNEGLAPPTRGTGGAGVLAARVQDSLRGEVDHMVARGSWRAGGASASSDVQGNETRMRLAGSLGERGAIRMHGRRGSLDSSSDAATAALSRGAADVDVDLSYDTSVDENLAMRAFYSTGDLFLEDRLGPASGARQSQRSWGYDARWRKQVGAASHVKLQVGFQDASLDPGESIAGGWDSAQGGADNRAIGAEGSYQNMAGDGHVVRLGVRAQRLSFQAPTARLGRENGGISWDGGAGWSVLVDTEDQWSAAGPFVVTYGLAVRQVSDGPDATSVAPRVGATWGFGWVETGGSVSYLATSGARSGYGYDVMMKARVDDGTTLRATASYVPSRAGVWGNDAIPRDADALLVTDGLASDRFVALELEHVAPLATVFFRLGSGRAEGALAPAWDEDVPVVLLSDRVLDYESARLGIRAPRAGTSISVEYRSIHDETREVSAPDVETLKLLELDFAQDLVRFAGGRASCRLLVTARSATGPGPIVAEGDSVDARRVVAEHKRVAAGVSLAF